MGGGVGLLLKYHEYLPVGRACSKLGAVWSLKRGRNYLLKRSRQTIFLRAFSQTDGSWLFFTSGGVSRWILGDIERNGSASSLLVAPWKLRLMKFADVNIKLPDILWYWCRVGHFRLCWAGMLLNIKHPVVRCERQCLGKKVQDFKNRTRMPEGTLPKRYQSPDFLI